ncbi:MAG TPA: hypothetical protein VJV78_15650 [Polyangiales bacterium]|nr:hypothetical protein [Polyangiales bacterium]
MKRALLRSFLMCFALFAVACSQNEGEPCQVSSDCDDGLICCPARDTPRGTCITDKSCPATEVPSRPDEEDDAGNGESTEESTNE